MNDGIKKLREIGTQKIYEQTHISRANIEAILDQTYTGMMPVQISGFISILEREYDVDLSDLKDSYNADTNDLAIKIKVKVNRSDTELSEPHLEGEQRSWKWLIALLLIAVVFAVVMMTGGKDEEQLRPVDDDQEIVMQSPDAVSQDAAIEEPDTEVLEGVDEMSVDTRDQDQSTLEAAVASTNEAEAVDEPVLATEYLTIVPKARLWMGIIDLSTKKRSVEITEERVDLNSSKPWLLVFGHGHFSIENGEQELKFKRQSKVRLLFEDGVVNEIDVEEYKARNKGRNW